VFELEADPHVDPRSIPPSQPLRNGPLLCAGSIGASGSHPAVEIFEISYGNDHSNVATALNNLAQLLQDTNRVAEAEPLMRRMVQILIALLKQGYQHANSRP
jgi:hypothetical protein